MAGSKILIGHASKNEKNEYWLGEPGDQTKEEVYIRPWYANGWNKLIRAKDPKVAQTLARKMEAACINDNIGYSQADRLGLYNEALKTNWIIKDIKKKCNTDCSALVAVCVLAAGIKVSEKMYTGNEANLLQKTGQFEILTDKKYLVTDANLKRGDILLKEGHHTAIVLGTAQEIENGHKK